MTTYVLAGNVEEFDAWRRENRPGAPWSEVRNLSSGPTTCGIMVREGDELVMIGAYWRNRDLRWILRNMEIGCLKSRAPNHQVLDLVRLLWDAL